MMSDDDNRLPPCPWCQSVELTAVQFQGRGYIRCLTCGAQGPATAVSITEARAAWNRRASGWQPIETAPRDGEPIMIGCSRTQSQRWAVWSGGMWRDGQDFAGGRISGVPSPTHWRPLFTPPAALARAKAEGL
jgi:hypothetical protein